MNAKAKKYKKEFPIQRVSEVEVMTLLREKKLKGKDLKKLKSFTLFSDAIISSWLHINVKTLRTYRDENKALPQDVAEHLILLLSMFELGVSLFASKESFDNWLSQSNFFFDDAAPIEFLGSVSGIRFISSRLLAMQFGDNI